MFQIFVIVIIVDFSVVMKCYVKRFLLLSFRPSSFSCKHYTVYTIVLSTEPHPLLTTSCDGVRRLLRTCERKLWSSFHFVESDATRVPVALWNSDSHQFYIMCSDPSDEPLQCSVGTLDLCCAMRTSMVTSVTSQTSHQINFNSSVALQKEVVFG